MTEGTVYAPLYCIHSGVESSQSLDHLLSLDWPVQMFYSADTLTVLNDHVPLVVVLETAGDSRAATTLASAIRKRDDILAFAPLLAIGVPPTMDTERQSARIDQWLAPDLTGSQMAAIVMEWTPEPHVALERLMAFFGQDEIASLTARFRDMLIEALDAIETPAAPMVAHRVAGMAGTLGFARLGACWAAFTSAEQDMTDILRVTRKAVFEISRRLQRKRDASAIPVG